MSTTATAEMNPYLELRASDVSGQRTVKVSRVARDLSVGQLVKSVLAKMRLDPSDEAGKPVTYRARLEREGRGLNRSERVGDVLQSDDHIVLQPYVQAGGASRRA